MRREEVWEPVCRPMTRAAFRPNVNPLPAQANRGIKERSRLAPGPLETVGTVCHWPLERPAIMVSKKSRSGQGAETRKFRSQVAELKRLGLVSARVDARKQKPTRHMKSQVARFEPVLSGRAKVVHTKTAKQARGFDQTFDVKGKSVVVPVEHRTDRVRYNPKSGKISGTTQVGGKRTHVEYAPIDSSGGELRPLRNGEVYTIPLGMGLRSFDDKQDFLTFMFPYETDPRKPYRDWVKYVRIERSEAGEQEFA